MYVNSDNFNYTGSDLEVMKLLIDNVEHLLYENNVNLAFWGHNHQVTVITTHHHIHHTQLLSS